MIKAIFWDNDGVLVDTEKLYFKANKIIFSKIGIDLTKEMYVENFLVNAKGTWHLAADKGFSEEDISKLRNQRNTIYAGLLESESKVISGVEDTLRKLCGKFNMGVVTSSRKEHFEIIHNKTNLLQYFNFTLTSDDFSKSKPDPEPYLKALAKTGLKKEECIVVEDSRRGLTAALSAGLKCYIIPTELTKRSNFNGAEKVLSSVTQLSGELV